MDLFRLGFRNLMGVLLPGTLFVLVLIYVVFTGAKAADWQIQTSVLDRWSSAIIIFLISYLVGSLMRLNSADNVDAKWFEYSQKEFRPEAASSTLDDDWSDTARELTDEDVTNQMKLEKIWRTDEFPYPVWHFYKLKLFHPPEAYQFFSRYRGCMRQHEGSGKLGKEFFNYCKTTVLYSRPQVGDALVAEIQTAEALVRFYAGTFYALVYGMWMLTALFVWQVAWLIAKSRPSIQSDWKASIPQLSTIVMTGLLAGSGWAMQRMIVKRFRTMRLKEVDTVYDAFYLVHRHAASCPECAVGKHA